MRRLLSPVAPDYLPALRRALFWQSLFLCLSALVLDFYYFNHLVIVAGLAHWFAIGMIVVRRRHSPTTSDLFVCRAYPLILVVTMVIAPAVMGNGLFHRTLLEQWFGFNLMHDYQFAGGMLLIPAGIWVVIQPFLGKAMRKPTIPEKDWHPRHGL